MELSISKPHRWPCFVQLSLIPTPCEYVFQSAPIARIIAYCYARMRASYLAGDELSWLRWCCLREVGPRNVDSLHIPR